MSGLPRFEYSSRVNQNLGIFPSYDFLKSSRLLLLINSSSSSILFLLIFYALTGNRQIYSYQYGYTTLHLVNHSDCLPSWYSESTEAPGTIVSYSKCCFIILLGAYILRNISRFTRFWF